MNQLKSCIIIGLLILTGCGGSSMSLESLFSIPSDITPSELENQGFEVSMDDWPLIQDKGPSGILEAEEYLISIGYTRDNKMEHLGINMSDADFEKSTKLKPANYDSVMIGNFAYNVKYYEDSKSIFAGRLGL